MTATDQVITGLVSAVGGLAAGIGGMFTIRPSNNRTNAEAHKADADAQIALQKAAADAITNIQKVADEAVKSSRAETERALAELTSVTRKLESVQSQAELVQERLRQTESELIQTRKENEAIRTAQSAERKQLLDQMSTERAEHTAAMNLARKQIQQLQSRRINNGGTGILLNPEEFGN